MTESRLDRGDPADVKLKYWEHLRRACAFDSDEQPAVDRAFRQAERHDALVERGRIVDSEPLVPAMTKAYGGDVVGRAEAALIRRLAEGAFGGLYAIEALRRRLASFKVDLLGPDPSPVERVIVDAIGCAWMDHNESTERAAKAQTGDLALLRYLEERKERSNKRLLAGLKALDQVRRKVLPTSAIQVNLTLPGRAPAEAIAPEAPADQLEAEEPGPREGLEGEEGLTPT